MDEQETDLRKNRSLTVIVLEETAKKHDFKKHLCGKHRHFVTVNIKTKLGARQETRLNGIFSNFESSKATWDVGESSSPTSSRGRPNQNLDFKKSFETLLGGMRSLASFTTRQERREIMVESLNINTEPMRFE
ncbi:unnamed protein product [Dovyalis caffra]|uniref:Uncharacterized protein n=1 Tax=Dovyalis caffra TaxID=77055 RepID=A0AAV1QQM3_9ROSI|nr:unnamed protein product [Dovyalis caffra]